MEQSLSWLPDQNLKFSLWWGFFLTNKGIIIYIINTFLWEKQVVELVWWAHILFGSAREGFCGIGKSNSSTDMYLLWLTERAIPRLSSTAIALPTLTCITFATLSCLTQLPGTSNFKEGIYRVGFNSIWKLFFSIAIYLIAHIQRILSSTWASFPSFCSRNVQVILNLILYLWTYS